MIPWITIKELFARFGLPETIVFNNGTPFTLKQLKKFCKLFSINHLKSTSYHPRSNGVVKRFIEQLKRQIQSKQKMKNYKNLYPFIE